MLCKLQVGYSSSHGSVATLHCGHICVLHQGFVTVVVVKPVVIKSDGSGPFQCLQPCVTIIRVRCPEYCRVLLRRDGKCVRSLGWNMAQPKVIT